MTHSDVEERLRKGQSIFEQATLAYIEELKAENADLRERRMEAEFNFTLLELTHKETLAYVEELKDELIGIVKTK